MEQRNEPSTAEIVKALRCNPEDSCIGCPYCITVSWCQEDGTADTDCNDKVLYYDAARRLEQLERDLKAFKAFHERYAEQTSKKYVDDICALTARAESAERERDAAIERLNNAMRGVEGIKRGLQPHEGGKT